MRVVVDTNIFFSALTAKPSSGPLSKPVSLLLRAGFGHFTLVTSEEILSELEEVLARKLQWEQPRLTLTIERIRGIAEVVVPNMSVAVCRDPDDDRILEVALAGAAHVIVTGDKDLLSMKSFRGIEICTASDFLLRLDDAHLRP